MKVFLNSKFQIEKVEDKLEDALVKGSTRFDLLTVYIPTELKESFSSIAPMYSVKRADGLKLGPYGTLANEELFEQDLSVDGYYGWAGYFNTRDLSVKGALEITFAFVINDSTIKTVASVTTNVINAVEVTDDVYVIGDNQVITSLVNSVRNLLVNSLTMANDVVQDETALQEYITTDLPDGFRILVMNDSNCGNNPVLYKWNGTVWQNKGYFDWTGYLDVKFDDYKTELDEHIDARLDAQDEQIRDLGQLQPSGTATSSVILAKTTADGIWIGTDTGHWYYWNGTQYADGGVYQATAIGDNTIGLNKLTNELKEKLLMKSDTLVYNNPSAPYDDCNTFPMNKIVSILNTEGLSNAPTDFQGNIITFYGAGTTVISQIGISINNIIYVRNKFGANAWSSWKTYNSDDYLKKNNILVYNNPTAPYDDCDTFPINEIVSILNTEGLSNAPTDFQGNIITLSGNSGGNVKTQIAYSLSDVYVRTKFGSNAWSNWCRQINENSIEFNNKSELLKQISNPSLAEIDKAWLCTGTNPSYYNASGWRALRVDVSNYKKIAIYDANTPSVFAAFVAIDNVKISNLDDYQLFYDVPSNAKYLLISGNDEKVPRVYNFDYKTLGVGVGSYPNQLGYVYGVGDSVNIARTKNNSLDDNYISLAMFPKMAVIGDSYSSGLVYDESGGIGADYQLSWLTMMARRNGSVGTCYSYGGANTHTWLENNEHGLSVMLADTPKNLYTIMLGINDSSSVTLGTIADATDDYDENPNTFYGNYARIIRNIQVHAPYSKIVLIVPPLTNVNYKQAIRDLATKYSLPYIETNDEYFSSQYYILKYGHPVASSYSGMSKIYEKEICKAILNNPLYFNDYVCDNPLT